MPRAATLAFALAIAAAAAGCSGKAGAPPAPRDGGPATDAAPGEDDALVAPGLRLPAGVDPLGYRLVLDVDPGKDKFHGEVEIKLVFAAPADHVWLHAVDLELGAIEVAVGGKTQPGHVLPDQGDEMVAIDLGGTVPAGLVSLTIAYDGTYHDNDQVGLFREKLGGKWYVFSQLEAVHARKLVPCLDEPHWKVPWQVTIDAPPGVTAVANAPVTSVAKFSDGRTFHFAPTEPLPSYLVAVAVGPFAVLDLGRIGARKIPLRVVAPAGTSAASAARVRAAVPKIVDKLEAYFALPLPFSKLDLIAVPDFPGAMENAGAIVIDRDLLLSSSYGEMVAYLSHEIAHQWFGNLVTLAWWDDLWLNESFASWMGNKLTTVLAPKRDATLTGHRDSEKAMRADVSPTAAALRRETIKTNADIEASFDAIAYEKGAAVIAMFEGWIGEDKLRDAIRVYLADHAGKVTSSAEFLDAIERGTDAATRNAFATFVDQAGVPLVTLERRCTGPSPVIAVKQERLVPVGTASPATTWRIPLCLRFPGQTVAADGGCRMLAGPTAEITLEGATCPAWVVGNAGDRGYYRVRVDAATMPPMAEMTPRERLGVVGGLGALIDAGAADPLVVAQVVPALLASGDKRDEKLAIDLVRRTENLVSDAHHPAWQRWARPLVEKVIAKAKLDAGGDLRWDRVELAADALGDPRVIADARARAERWLDGKLVLKGYDLELVLTTAADGGDLELADRLLARAATLPAGRDRRTVLTALGTFASADAARSELAAVVGTAFAVEDVDSALEAMAGHAATRGALLAVYADPDRRATLLAKLTSQQAETLLEPFATVCDPVEAIQTIATLTPLAIGLERGDTKLAEVVESIDRCVARRAALGPAFEAALGPP